MGIDTHTIGIDTADGLRLVGDVTRAPHPRAAAVLCHPHPLHGGDRHNAVVHALFTGLGADGLSVLRFDFRGVNDSEGSHGGGTDERLDVAGAVDALASLVDVPIWVVGYSFGAAVALDTVHPAIAGWVGVAPPLAAMGAERLASTDARPKHLIVPRHDQFSPPDATEPIVAGWTSTTIDVIESADHFLNGHLADVARLTSAAIR